MFGIFKEIYVKSKSDNYEHARRITRSVVAKLQHVSRSNKNIPS
jgi:hypothetical protein